MNANERTAISFLSDCLDSFQAGELEDAAHEAGEAQRYLIHAAKKKG